jgi:EAL domain-containing protein (putative c-di-GMP-specific phosphodiesterase class I)
VTPRASRIALIVASVPDETRRTMSMPGTARILDDKDSENIVRCAVELAHNLELEVVAEGVENQSTWLRIADLGCDVGQGYWIGRPMPSDQFGDWQLPRDRREGSH